MASIFKVDFPGFTAKVELVSGGWAEMGQGMLVRLYSLFWAMHAVVPIAKFEVKQTAAGPPVVLSYEITAQDGREWKQTLTFAMVDDPGQTFEVVTPWRLSEFVPGRALRDEVVALHARYGVTKITIEVT